MEAKKKIQDTVEEITDVDTQDKVVEETVSASVDTENKEKDEEDSKKDSKKTEGSFEIRINGDPAPDPSGKLRGCLIETAGSGDMYAMLQSYSQVVTAISQMLLKFADSGPKRFLLMSVLASDLRSIVDNSFQPPEGSRMTEVLRGESRESTLQNLMEKLQTARQQRESESGGDTCECSACTMRREFEKVALKAAGGKTTH